MAGAILHYGGTRRGLTTAASLWSVAAVGMAAGAGLYVVATLGAVLVIIGLEVFQRIEGVVKRRLDIPPRRRQTDIQEPEEHL